MYSLVIDSINKIASLYKGKTLCGFEFEKNHSCYNEFPVFCIKIILDRFNIQMSNIENFIYAGNKNIQEFQAILNLNLLEMYDHFNRKEIISINPQKAYIFAKCIESNFEKCSVITWDINGINSFEYNNGLITKDLFDVDENQDIIFFTKEIFKIDQKNFFNTFITGGFDEDLTLYNKMKEKSIILSPDGRVNIKREIFSQMLKENSNHPKLIYSIKKIIDDILIHVSNYVKYLTKNINCVFTGDLCKISLANARMNPFIPFEDYFLELTEFNTDICYGALNLFYYEQNNINSEQNEINNIRNIIKKLFDDFHSEKVQRIQKYFLYQDDEVFIAIKDLINKCKNIKINFVLKDIAISSSKMRGWASFYFYFFGTYKESKHPVILNYKAMMFLKRENSSWNISDLEFYSFDNLPILTLELANSCNYKCIMCDTNMQKKEFMNFNTFKNIIDSLKDFKVGTITPFWLGEPLLNPDFEKMTDYLFEQNENNERFVSFTINTNTSLLNSSKTDCILRNASRNNMNENTFIRMHFSVDSIESKTYKTIHGVDLCETVKENIISFLKKRKELGLQYPKVTIAMIIMDENKDEAREFLDYWYDVLKKYSDQFYVTYDWPYLEKDAIYFRRLDCKDQNRSEQMHYQVVKELGILEDAMHYEYTKQYNNMEDQQLNTYEDSNDNLEIEETNQENNSDKKDELSKTNIENNESQKDDNNDQSENNQRILNTDSVLITSNMDYFVRRPCPAIWKTPIISANGDVTTCCFDIDMKLKLGNINKNSLKNIWNGELIKKWRLYHLRGEFNKINRCRECHNINSPTMKNSEFIEYLLNLGLKEEIEKAHFLK